MVAIGAPIPVACTLTSDQISGRLDEWRTALAQVSERDRVDAGVRVTLPRSTALGPLVALVEAEQACCRFLTFSLVVGPSAVTLEVVGPPDAAPVIEALVGPA